MNLAALDLNLLVALDALISEAHVGRAARRIGLSQPAASHALRRLREILKDPLLVRAGSRLQLTPKASGLRSPVSETLQRIRGLFLPATFEPRTSTRRFVLMLPDHVVDLMLPPLLSRIASHAPQIRIDVAPWRGAHTLTTELAGSIDLAIACTGDAFPGFLGQRLFSDTEAIAVRRGHPQAAKIARLQAFLKARHVAVVGPGQREDPVDTWLREKNVARDIALTVPGYLQALHVAARTDLAAFVPRRLIEALARSLALRMIKPPIDPGNYEEFLFTPARLQQDPGSIWMRNQVLAIGRSLDRAPAKPTRRSMISPIAASARAAISARV